jgi:uncharacterized protein (TIRG00374 family)
MALSSRPPATDAAAGNSGRAGADHEFSGDDTRADGKGASLKQPAPRSGKRLAWTLLRLLVTLGLVAFLFRQTNLTEVGRVLAASNWLLIALAAAGMVVKNIFGGWRWQVLLAASGCRCGMGTLTRIYLIGWFYGNFLPTQIGGDVARGIYLNRVAPGFIQPNVVAMVVERVMGLVALGVLAMVGTWVAPEPLPAWLSRSVMGFGVLSLVAGAFVFYAPYEKLAERLLTRWVPKLAPRVVGLLQAMDRFRHPAILAKVFVGSLLFQLATIACVYLAGVAVGATVSWRAYAVFIPLSFIAGMIPVTLNGYGIRENVLERLLTTQAGASAETATTIALLFALLLTFRAAVGGLALLGLSGAGKKRA